VTTPPLVRVEQTTARVTTITISRPERLNALSLPTIGALKDAFAEVGADADTHVAVLTGAGRAFCAGLDLKEPGSAPLSEGLHGVAAAARGQAYFGDVVQRLRAMPQPVVAAINGVAVGGGLALTAGCDVRLAGASARFNVQAGRLGLSAGETGLSFTLPHLLPAGPAFELITRNRFFDAAEAERIGYVHRVVPDDEVLDAALAVATTIAAHDRSLLVAAKQVMWSNLTAPSLDAALLAERYALAHIDPTDAPTRAEEHAHV
jgi:enoyl-CoA hydratase/carnithine racemase